MPHFLEPIAAINDLDENEVLNACLVRSYAAFRPWLQAHFGLMGFPQEAKTGGQLTKAIEPVMQAIALLEGENTDHSSLIKVLGLWIQLLERMVTHGLDIRARNSSALYSYALAAGTATQLDVAVQRWQKRMTS